VIAAVNIIIENKEIVRAMFFHSWKGCLKMEILLTTQRALKLSTLWNSNFLC